MLDSKYWEDRYRAEEKARELADKRVAYQLQGVYQQHANNIQKEIDSFWQRYADKEGITKLEAKQRADSLDMVNVGFKAKQLVERANRLRKRGQKVTSKDFTKAENDLMRLYNLKMKTSRLEVLQANIKLHQYDLALSEFEIIDKHLIESIRRENLFSAGVLNMTLGSFESSKVSADSIVYANFNNATWSSRVWERQNELRNIVKKGVADTVLRGKGTNVLINNLKKEFDVSYSYARRLAVTESARVYSEAQKSNYETNGVEEFEVMTELKACHICQPFNGKIFKVSELVPALNAPPFHPNCRCTTVPHFRKDAHRYERDNDTDHKVSNNNHVAKGREKMYNHGMSPIDLMAKRRSFVVGDDIRLNAKKLSGTEFDFWVQDDTKKIRDTVSNVQSSLKELNDFSTPTFVFLKKSKIRGLAGYDYKQDIIFVSDALHSEIEFAKVLSDNFFAAQNIKETMVHELAHKKHWDSAKAFYKANKKRYNSVEQAMSELNSPLVSYVKEQLKHDYNYLYSISDNAAIAFYKNNINELVAEVGVLGDKVTDKNLLNKVKEVLSWK
jgi:phage protein|nr:MAG TPA: minor capsid protein [Caudoviricetes sp.]